MSERGSFVTEYIYCKDCVEAVRQVFSSLEQGKWFYSVQVIQGLYPQPIFAGRIGESWMGGETVAFETEILPELNMVVCHEVRIVVIPESGEPRTFVAMPEEVEDECPAVRRPSAQGLCRDPPHLSP